MDSNLPNRWCYPSLDDWDLIYSKQLLKGIGCCHNQFRFVPEMFWNDIYYVLNIDLKKEFLIRKWFEPRSNIPWLKRSSRWLESWEGLLFVTDVSTTCAEAIFRVKWQSFLCIKPPCNKLPCNEDVIFQVKWFSPSFYTGFNVSWLWWWILTGSWRCYDSCCNEMSL